MEGEGALFISPRARFLRLRDSGGADGIE